MMSLDDITVILLMKMKGATSVPHKEWDYYHTGKCSLYV